MLRLKEAEAQRRAKEAEAQRRLLQVMKLFLQFCGKKSFCFSFVIILILKIDWKFCSFKGALLFLAGKRTRRT